MFRLVLLARAAAVAFAFSVLAAACGEGGGDANDAAEPTTRVEVTLWPDGRSGGESRTVTLTCEPAGGTHPNPAEACAALGRDEAALDSVPGDVACTQIFGGPQEARVFGVVGGREVDAAFTRTNGCEIDRWDRLAPFLEITPQS